MKYILASMIMPVAEWLGPGWYQPFDDEVGLYSGIGTDDEQENDKRYDDLILFLADKLAEREEK